MCVSVSVTRSGYLQQQLQSILGAGVGGRGRPCLLPLHPPSSLPLPCDWLLFRPADCPLSDRETEREGERGRVMEASAMG